MKKEKKDLKVLSLFSGCGGLDLGFEGDFSVLKNCLNKSVHPEWFNGGNNSQWVKVPKTKFKVVFANDIMPAARSSWLPYFQSKGNSVIFHTESIVELVKKHKKGKKIFPKVDVVTGGFPCQDFSVAGKRKGFNSHKGHHGDLLTSKDKPTEENRGKLYMWMRHVIDIVRPKMFIAENVKGLVTLADAKVIIENDFRSIGEGGYVVVSAKVLSAADYGVSQRRERVLFIGFRKDTLKKKALQAFSNGIIPEEFDPYPRPTHGTSRNNCVRPYVTVKQALVGLYEPERSSDLAQKSFSRAKWYGRHCQGQNEVNLNGLGPTIRSEHHGNIEFRRLSPDNGGKYLDEIKKGMKERRLTVRECARLQTFPDDYAFVRNSSTNGNGYNLSASEGYKLIGNAVPPLLGFHLAWRLQEIWSDVFK
ncbi:MAG: DNA (cytosine-5-)-methyltransferase [Candidatus Omnitrophica bacterium]|nr:DNA (cytosine-5-)-methyltransferase [Candidatus Omnitrophota bacterium]